MRSVLALALMCVLIGLAWAQSPPGTGPQGTIPPSTYQGSGSPNVNATSGSVVTQTYNLTASGAQTGINLQGSPVDTHTISWRPILAPAITDAFPYANGDLATANANWVYQSGTFQVSGNAAYPSAALAFAYRSDGPTAQGTEWAQGVAVINAQAATQNGGICVRMSTSAQTGYCLQAAQNVLSLLKYVAGAQTVLAAYIATNPTPATGTILTITASGTTITAYENGVCLTLAGACGVTDAAIATGSTGMFGAANATQNGISNFQSGTTIPNCAVQLDSSADGVNWTSGGAVPSQNCSFVANFSGSRLTANYVRVNATVLSGITSLAVVYSGRQSPTPTSGGPVSNGQWVNAGEVLFTQNTTQGIGSGTVNSSFRIQQVGGATYTNSWSVACTFSVSGGVGTGFQVPVSGFLNGFTTYVSSGGFPQGAIYTNLYLLSNMPAGASTTTCANTLTAGNIAGGLLLASMPTGSSYPVSFVGTSAIPVSPWSIPGFTNVTNVTAPGAGAEWSFTIPGLGGGGGGSRTCIQSVSFQLVTSAAVANRVPVLVLTLNGAKLVYSPTTAQAASLTQVYSFAPGAATETVTGGATVFHIVPFNNGQLVCYNGGLTTATIGTLTTAKDAADQYSAINIITQVQQDNN